MLEAHSQKELIEILRMLKVKHAFKSFKPEKYQYMNSHEDVAHHGETLDVKINNIAGFGLFLGRVLGEKKYNDEFIVYESPQETINREAETYRRLISEGFPTVESRQELILEEQKFIPSQPRINGVLLTKKVKLSRPLIDIILESPKKEKLEYVAQVARLLKQLHTKHRQIWGDPWLGNCMYAPEGIILLSDFGFKPNPNKPKEFLQAKDLVGLCISAVYRTGENPLDVVKTVIENYAPNREVKHTIAVLVAIEKKFPMQGKERFVREKLFYLPVFGMDTQQVDDVRNKIYYVIK